MRIFFNVSLILLVTMTFLPAQSSLSGQFDLDSQTFQPTDPNYWVGDFVDGYAVVRYQGKFGFIDQEGGIVAPIEQEVLPIPASFIATPTAMDQEKVSIGMLILSPASPDSPINSVCTGGNGGTYYLVNHEGEVIVPHRLIWPTMLDSQMMRIGPGRIAFVTYDPNHHSLECARCGICPGYMGVVDSKGEIIIAPDRYRTIHFFENGKTKAIDDEGRTFLLDLDGKVLGELDSE